MWTTYEKVAYDVKLIGEMLPKLTESFFEGTVAQSIS